MSETIIHLFDSLPARWTTFIISMLPIVELRGAIPFGIARGMGWLETYVIAVIGNMIPIVPILLYLGPISDWLRRLPGFGRFFDWLFTRTRKKSGPMEKYGPWGLAVFVGIPLPATGAWTGAAAAFVLGYPFRVSFPAIFGGVLLAGAVVTLAVEGLVGLGGLFGVGH